MFKSSSVHAKVLKVLQSGKKLTPKQIASRYGVVNPHDPVYILTEHGYFITRKYKKTKQGYETVTYSMSM